MRREIILPAFAILMCSGCATDSMVREAEKQVTLPAYSLPAQHTEITLSADDLYVLSELQKQDFLHYYNDERNAHLKPNQRVYTYLANILSGFKYNGETLPASAALEQKTGNCISLAVLTAALADAANVPIDFQKVNSEPVFRQKENILLISRHVRSILYDPTYVKAKNEILISRPRTIVDYFPSAGSLAGEIVHKNAITAMFFRNLAAKSLLDGDIATSLVYAQVAIRTQPDSANNIGLMALLLNKADNPKDAKTLYDFAMDNGFTNISLLDNYKLFLQGQGMNAQADAIDDSYTTANEDNPYAWVLKGREAYRHGNLRKAQALFLKALTIAPYLDDVFVDLAKTYKAKGDEDAARTALNQAISHAWSDEDKALYEAKLRGLDVY